MKDVQCILKLSGSLERKISDRPTVLKVSSTRDRGLQVKSAPIPLPHERVHMKLILKANVFLPL